MTICLFAQVITSMRKSDKFGFVVAHIGNGVVVGGGHMLLLMLLLFLLPNWLV
jgi:hypothetical protein